MSYSIYKKLLYNTPKEGEKIVYYPVEKDVTDTKQGALSIVMDQCLKSNEKLDNFVIIGDVSEARELYERKKQENGSL